MTSFKVQTTTGKGVMFKTPDVNMFDFCSQPSRDALAASATQECTARTFLLDTTADFMIHTHPTSGQTGWDHLVATPNPCMPHHNSNLLTVAQ